MPFEITLIQLITICAIMNGFVFSFLLLEKKENRFANRFLSLMIFSLCLTFTPYMLDMSIWNTIRWLAWMPFSLTYWVGPALYFYVKSLVDPSRKFRKQDLLHFSPIVLNYVHSIYHAVTYSNPWPWFHHVAELFEAAAILSIIIYMILTYKMIKPYHESLLQQVSNIENLDLRWIQRMILVITGSFLLVLVFLIITTGLFGKEQFGNWNTYLEAMLVFYSILLYWISINGFKQAQIIGINLPGEPKNESPIKFSEIGDNINTLVKDQQLYQNKDFSLADLSKASGISQRTLSETINNEFGKNYFQFINDFRVEEVKAKLVDPKHDHLKLLSLGMDSGFNSKASFNRIFKSSTGLTPKEYREKHQK